MNIINDYKHGRFKTGTIAGRIDEFLGRAPGRGADAYGHVPNIKFAAKWHIDAFDNFVADKSPNKGVPIGFYLKHLSKQDIELLWRNTYYPASSGPTLTTKQ